TASEPTLSTAYRSLSLATASRVFLSAAARHRARSRSSCELESEPPASDCCRVMSSVGCIRRRMVRAGLRRLDMTCLGGRVACAPRAARAAVSVPFLYVGLRPRLRTPRRILFERGTKPRENEEP